MIEKPTYKELEQMVMGLKLETRDFVTTKKLLAQLERKLEIANRDLEQSLERANQMIVEAEIAYLELNQIFNNTSDGICVIDVNSNLMRINNALLNYCGLDADEALNLKCYDLLNNTLCHGPNCPLNLIKAGKTIVECDVKIKTGNGATIPFMITAKPFRGLDAELIGMVADFKDITERKRYEEQLQLSASVFDNTIEAITITDAKGIIEKVNPAFAATTGYTAEEVIGKNHRILNSDHHGPEFYKKILDALIQTDCWSGEVWNRRKNGEAFIKWLSITAIKDAWGQTGHYVSVFRDITDIKRSEEKIKYQAYHDALTGLPNRLLFMDRLEMALAHAKRHEQMVAVMFLDLDDFKNVNDRLGHNIGDLLLREVAKRLKMSCRQSDTVSRLGGDEFTLILPEIQNEEHNAIRIANRINTSFSKPFILNGHEILVSSSIGISFYPVDGEDVETLLKTADKAMYRGKEKGKQQLNLNHLPQVN